MNIRTLRQLLAIREHGSFARAARALGVSQPNLSKNIARLEDELRGRIFLRTSGGAELTPFGQLVADQAARVIEQAELLERAAQLAAGGPSSMLRIGCGPELKRAFAPRLLAALVSNWPQLNIRLEVSDRHRLVPALRSRELDVIFCIIDDAVIGEGQRVSPVLSSFGVTLAAPNHPLAREATVTPERYLQFANAGPRNTYFTSQARFGSDPSSASGARYELSDFEPFMPLVLEGRATIRLPAFEAEPYVAAGTLVQINLATRVELFYGGVTTAAAATFPIVNDALRVAREIGAELGETQKALQRL